MQPLTNGPSICHNKAPKLRTRITYGRSRIVRVTGYTQWKPNTRWKPNIGDGPGWTSLCRNGRKHFGEIRYREAERAWTKISESNQKVSTVVQDKCPTLNIRKWRAFCRGSTRRDGKGTMKTSHDKGGKSSGVYVLLGNSLTPNRSSIYAYGIRTEAEARWTRWYAQVQSTTSCVRQWKHCLQRENLFAGRMSLCN